jgi:hypothetical protein
MFCVANFAAVKEKDYVITRGNSKYPSGLMGVTKQNLFIFQTIQNVSLKCTE